MPVTEIKVNPPVRLDAHLGDVELTPDQLRQISFFKIVEDQRRYLPKFEEQPGAVKLRFFKKGDIVWRQGETGFTAFYILSPVDVRQLQLPVSADDGDKVATVHLAVARKQETQPTRRGVWDWLTGKSSGRPTASSSQDPVYIPFDGPTDIDYETLQAELQPGELFGEAGCLDGLPRSATVVAARDWYMLEILRNILVDLQKDAGYKKYWDNLYKSRGLGLQLRKFSIFRDLADDQFQQLVQDFKADLDSKKPDEEKAVALISRKHGEIICDEHDVSDSMYIIRSGLVQVVKNVSPLIGQSDVLDWPKLCAALAEGEQQPDTPKGLVWQRLAIFQDDLRASMNEMQLPESRRQEIVYALNTVIKDPNFFDPVKFAEAVQSANLTTEAKAVPANRAKWAKADARRFNRLLFEAIYSGIIRRRWQTTDPELILAYLSRGETIGEMGLIRKKPRSATCIAYVHEHSNRGEVSLLRISAQTLERFLQPGTPLYLQLQAVTEAREKDTAETLTGAVPDTSKRAVQSPRFKELSLIQGQKLMLIDLERCTRCDECVQACVNTHADGRSRLFLDGPRYEQQVGSRLKTYLTPSTCRSCLNPECMMNCPVGSIHRGNKGQIIIEDWCIGCQRCALYCPYGAIQMHDIGLIPEEASGWRYLPSQGVAKSTWNQLDFRDDDWLVGRTPFRYDEKFQKSLASPDEAVCFRYAFSLPTDRLTVESRFQLKVAAMHPTATVWINGRETVLPAEQQAGGWLETKKGWELRLDLSADSLRPGKNVAAVRVVPGPKSAEGLLSLSLYEVHKTAASTTADIQYLPKVVEQRAVVCDLCSTLPDGPACVKACPHEAAIRFDARTGVPVW